MKNRVLGWLIILLAVLGIAYLTATWYVGKLSHERLNLFVDQINEQVANQWSAENQAPTIKIIDYKTGLLTSLVTYQINYYQDDLPSEQMLLVDKLSHGPFPIAALSRGQFTPMIAYSQIKPLHGGVMQPWFDLMSDDALPWKLNNQYYFDGIVNSDLKLNAFTNVAHEIEFLGGSISSNYQPKLGHFKANGSFPGISFYESDSDTALDLQNLNIDVLTIKGSQQNIQSHQKINLSQLSASWSDGVDIVLKDPQFLVDSTHANELSDSTINYDLGQVFIGDTKFGNIQAVLSIKNLNTKLLQNIFDLLNDVDDDSLFFDPDLELDQKIQNKLNQLFVSSPVISLDNFEWQTETASSNLKSNLSFKSAVTGEVDNFISLIEKSIDEFQLDLALSKPMLMDILKTQFDDRTIQLISMFFDHYTAKAHRLGLLDIREQILNSEIRYANGLITVNGNVMSPLDFQERLGSIISP